MSPSAANAADAKPRILEMRLIKLRNTLDNMAQRTNEYLSKSYIPALNRAGVSPVGAFGSLVAADSPFVLLVSQYADMAAYGAAMEKVAADAEHAKALESYASGAIPFTRMEVTLLRGFTTVPAIELPPSLGDKKSHIFEIRRYESNTPWSLKKKIRMFDEGEVELFRKVNIRPVFFGETIAGGHMPNLTYMVAFESLAAREQAWSTFGSHPEWIKMRAQPGLSDAEIVSSITNYIVRPANYSAIR